MTPDTHFLSFIDHLQVPNWFLSYNLPALPSAKHAHQWHSQISANTTFLEVSPRHLTERGHHVNLPSSCSICSTVPITSWNPLFKYLSLSLEQKLHENKHLHFGVPKHSESRPKAPCTYLLNEGMKPKCMGSFWWTKITPVNIRAMVSAQCLWRSATAGLSEGHTVSFALPAFSYRCTANIYWCSLSSLEAYSRTEKSVMMVLSHHLSTPTLVQTSVSPWIFQRLFLAPFWI